MWILFVRAAHFDATAAIQFVHILIRFITNRHISMIVNGKVLHSQCAFGCWLLALQWWLLWKKRGRSVVELSTWSCPFAVFCGKSRNLDTIPNLFIQCYCHRIDRNPMIFMPFSAHQTVPNWCCGSNNTTK